MEVLVLLDTNVVLAACLPPSMDSKGAMAEQVIRTLEKNGIRPAITETVKEEFEKKLYERVGWILDTLRKLYSEPMNPASTDDVNALDALEAIFARLRTENKEALGALQLLEIEIAASLEEKQVKTENWGNLILSLTAKTTIMHAEIIRRFDTISIEIIAKQPLSDPTRFEGSVPKSDIPHIAAAEAVAKAKSSKVIFVTLDGELHSKRDAVQEVAPDLVVTTPPFLQRQIDRLSGL